MLVPTFVILWLRCVSITQCLTEAHLEPSQKTKMNLFVQRVKG